MSNRADPKGFSGSVVRIPDDGPGAEAARHKICGCIPCDPKSYHAYVEMVDMSLLTDPIFILFAISNFCTSIGFNVPYVYMKVKNKRCLRIPRDKLKCFILLLAVRTKLRNWALNLKAPVSSLPSSALPTPLVVSSLVTSRTSPG